MIKKYKIIYTKLFYEDLKSILKYITKNLDNKIAANNLLNEIIIKINEKAENPIFLEKYNSKKNRKNQYYKINVNNFIIFYIIRDDKVMEIRRILYNRRNISKINL